MFAPAGLSLGDGTTVNPGISEGAVRVGEGGGDGDVVAPFKVPLRVEEPKMDLALVFLLMSSLLSL
jgi:hypothetical protein